MFSGEATAFIPGAHDSHAPAQEGNTGWAGEARLNAGRNFAIDLYRRPGFLDAEIAYRLRTEGPPDEWHGDLTVGFKFTPKIMLMLQDFTTVSMSTNNRTFPAWRQSVAEASVVYALNDKWSLQVGLFSTVWTVRTNTDMASRSPSGAIFDCAFMPGSRPSQLDRFDPEADLAFANRPIAVATTVPARLSKATAKSFWG